MEQFGLAYETLCKLNPGLIYASISEYGAEGPYAKRAGYDMIAAAEAGLLHITGGHNGPPTKPGVALTDISTGLYTHGEILAALQARHRTVASLKDAPSLKFLASLFPSDSSGASQHQHHQGSDTTSQTIRVPCRRPQQNSTHTPPDTAAQTYHVYCGGWELYKALAKKGIVFIWGIVGQFQLGQEILERCQLNALEPQQLGLPRNKIKYIACGSYYNFAAHKNGRVYAWGLNIYGQTGFSEGAGKGNAVIRRPTVVKSFEGHNIADIQGGNHHSIACAGDGTLLAWGRCNDGQAGVLIDKIPEADMVFDDRGKPSILTKPTVIPNLHTVFCCSRH